MAKSPKLSQKDKAALLRLNDILDDLDLNQHPLTDDQLEFLQDYLDRVGNSKIGRPATLEKYFRNIEIAVDAEILLRSGKFKTNNAAYTQVANDWSDNKNEHLEISGIRKIHQARIDDPFFHAALALRSRK